MNQLSTLLLVDPDPGGLETLTFGFEREGCTVTGTSDPARAVELARAASPQLVVVALRGAEPGGLDIVQGLRGSGVAANGTGVPVLTLGPPDLKAAALAAGADDFLPTPLFVRDVISVGKLRALGQAIPAADGDEAGVIEVQARLSDYHGLFYLLRAMAVTARSGILTLARGNQKAELRFNEGAVVSAHVAALQALPAVHNLLLWEEAALSFKLRSVTQRSQIHLSAQELLDECERFLRDLAFSARDLGPPHHVYVPAPDSDPAKAGLQPSQVGPMLRLFDGQRTLAAVIEESPFRIFDTLRMLKRLRDAGGLLLQPREGTADGPRSLLEQWAVVPDLRGVVGDRRRSQRRLKTVPGGAGPIPLTAKKPGGGTGRRSHKTPPLVMTAVGPDIGHDATIQVKVDGLPLPAPLLPARPAPLTALEPGRMTPIPLVKTPPPVRRTPPPVLEPDAAARLHEVVSPPRLTPSTAFDAVEADFFAREADLYKREKIESFEDLEPGSAPDPAHAFLTRPPKKKR
jgi:CheY-like chemotaxis protein